MRTPLTFAPSYYEHSVIRPPLRPMAEGSLQADVCVIGGGFSGLSCALSLAEKGLQVILLEAQALGWGASGRNGGQIIVGYANEHIFEEQLGLEAARQAWDISLQAAQLVIRRIHQYQIACDFQPGYMSLAVNARKAALLQQWSEQIAEKMGYPYEWIAPSQMGQYIQSDRFHSGLYDRQSGHFHPLKYALGLAQAAEQKGVRIYEQSPVIELQKQAGKVHVRTASAHVQAEFVVCAGGVYLNHYHPHFLPQITRRIMPVGTYMLATEPLEEKVVQEYLPSQAAVCDTNYILDYFRFSADHRLLYGGGVSYTAKEPKHLTRYVQQRMLKVFPHLKTARVDYTWGGYIDVTYNRGVDFGRIDEQIYYVQGFSGQGVALSNMAGNLVAEAIGGRPQRFDLFTQLQHRNFPRLSAARKALLILGATYYRLKDRYLGV